MICGLAGKIKKKSERGVALEVAGVIYRVFVPLSDLEIMPKVGQSVELFTYLAVREDSMDLYGFLGEKSRDFFELLLSVSGIGPKSALNVLSSASLDQLEEAIIVGSDEILTRVSGIGKKTAGRIILELKTKIKRIAREKNATGLVEDIEVLDALSALGFSMKEARQAIQDLPPDTKGVNDKVKAALKLLSNSRGK